MCVCVRACIVVYVLAHSGLYTPVKSQDVLCNDPVCSSARPSTIACESGNLKTVCLIDIALMSLLKTSDDIDLEHSTKNKVAAKAAGRLTLYHVQDIACERGTLKTD